MASNSDRASGSFIDPALLTLVGHGVSVLLTAGTTLLETGVTEAAAVAVLGPLAGIAIAAPIITSLIQSHFTYRGLEEDARRYEETIRRQSSEIRSLLSDFEMRQERALVQSEERTMQALVRSEERAMQARERAEFNTALHRLEDSIDSYRDYQRQFANDRSILIEATRNFQLDVSVRLRSVSNAMLRGHISLDDLRVWVNAAAYHIQMNFYMTNAGIQTPESFRIIVDIHRETSRQLCDAYRRSNQLTSTTREIREVEMYFDDASNSIEHPINRGADAITSEVAGSSD